MELRQLRYFARVVELGSMGKAAAELGVVTSALSQQISRLEGELATRLLTRTAAGVVPTDAGVAFWRQVQLALRHVDYAVDVAKNARLSGHVSVGMAPSTTGVLGLPFILAMRERYPDVKLRVVESLSGHLAAMLKSRQIDLAILFKADAGRFSVMQLLNERLFLITARGFAGNALPKSVHLDDIAKLPLILPTVAHGLRALLVESFARAHAEPNVVAEIDGLAMLMDAVRAGIGTTIQPGSALARLDRAEFDMHALAEHDAQRPNLLVSLSDDELSPAGLAARVVLADVVRARVRAGGWVGATLHDH
ncbi:LysR family transcriptional regulator [Burkholderia cepacia]|nr:LysR family transcriptional regulator [Burkholderia cepacia]